MSAFGKKLRLGEGGRLSFWCPGCNETHTIAHGSGEGPRWGWNGSGDAPVFTPSVLVTTGHYCSTHKPGDSCWCTWNAEHPDDPSSFGCARCHSFVGCNGAQPGQIIFLADSTHALAGKKVELPDWPRQDLPGD